MRPPPIARVAIYARLSVTTEESVSIERQIDSARKYANARSWQVVLAEVDDGVSATKNKPEDRAGWHAILDSPEQFDAVIVWKVDRLARRVLDFLHADEQLQARGAGIVAVEDPVDMTTAQGRAFATMLAVFGEMEAAAISARVSAARRAVVHAGRRVGGRPPFGWMNVPNPNGAGLVLAQDPETIDVVRELVVRAFAGESLYGMARWLEATGVKPRSRKGRDNNDRWHESSVESILRAPALAGMTPYTPGRKPGDDAPVEVLRDSDGLPLIDESVAIISPAERRRLLAILDDRKKPGSRPARPDAGLLSGILRCATCRKPLHRATSAGLPYYRCQNRECAQQVGTTRAAIESHVEGVFLDTIGRLPVTRFEEVEPRDEAPRLAEVEAAITDTLARMADDDADIVTLGERLATLKAARTRARAEATARPEVRMYETGQTFREAWDATEDIAARRELIASGVEAVYLRPAKARGGRGLDTSRVEVVWRNGDAHVESA